MSTSTKRKSANTSPSRAKAYLSSDVPQPESLRPLKDNVLVRLDDQFKHNITPGGIIIPDSTEAIIPSTGVVVNAGKACTELQAGDRVVVIRFAGIRLPVPEDRKDEEELWLMCAEDEVLGAWDDEAP